MAWPQVQTGRPVAADRQATTSSGVGLIRPLEATARKLGVEILLQHRMTSIIRENPTSGRVLGITATNQGKTTEHPGAEGRHHRHRRLYRQRELPQNVRPETDRGVLRWRGGEPYSFQDASGELAAMAIGASLWGAYNQTGEFGPVITKPGQIGCQYVLS